jgi:hypothetical protein
MRSRELDVHFVGIVRDFLLACRSLRRIAKAFHNETLEFRDVQALIGDTQNSILFRLKERCHALFRTAADGVALEAVFDLAVGALFHEAMKFRENYYQQAVYTPKLEALRQAGDSSAAGLLESSRELLREGHERSESSLHELTDLLAETQRHFHTLLRHNRENAHVTRFVVERAGLVEEALGESFDALLTEFWDDPGNAYTQAGYSYLVSGHFEDARQCLAEARTRRGEEAELLRWSAYAEGMQAYLESRYLEAVSDLGCWAEDPEAAGESVFGELAAAALERASKALLRTGEASEAERATALAERCRVIAGKPTSVS